MGSTQISSGSLSMVTFLRMRIICFLETMLIEASKVSRQLASFWLLRYGTILLC
jgi:hypothetical protein